MSSKTSSTTRFWRFIALLALVGVGFGCSGGGDDNGGGNPADAAPTFGGLTAVSSPNTTGNVVLTAREGSDDADKSQLQYLIFVSETFPFDQGPTPHAQFNGSSCSNGNCTFEIKDLAKDGSKKYYFSSRAKDQAGNTDQNTHSEEDADLSITPKQEFTIIGNNGNITTSLNVDGGRHAVDPSLTIINGTPYVIWEECADPTLPSPNGTSADHPCNIDEPSQIFMKRFNGTDWELVTDPANAGRNDLTKNPANDPTNHSHSPTLTSDSTDVYAAWREIGQNLFIQKYNGTQWISIDALGNPGFGGDRPALTLHTALGSNLGIAYEIAPSGVDHRQLFFRQWPGASPWSPAGATLNVNPDQAGEAPLFSQKSPDLYMTWKETTVKTPLPTPQDPNAHSHTIPNIYVRKWNSVSSTWDAASPSLNMNPAREARFPSVEVLGATPYVAWHECSDEGCNAEHIFVKRLEGGTWVPVPDVAGSLNHQSTFAKTPSLSVLGNQVFVAWSERDNTNVYKVRLKALTGNQWDFRGTLNIDPTKHAHSPVMVANGSLYVAWVERGANDKLQLFVAKTN
jgi:hypothetical protein